MIPNSYLAHRCDVSAWFKLIYFIVINFQTEIVYPTKAKSKEGFYEFVVNDEKNQQGVKVERCL